MKPYIELNRARQLEQFDFPIHCVQPWHSLVALILFFSVFSTLAFISFWINLILLLPALGIGVLIKGTKTRALTVFGHVFVPNGRWTDRAVLLRTLNHEGTHVQQQRDIGTFLFFAKWITPKGCVELESEAFISDIKWQMAIFDRETPWPELFEHYTEIIRNKYLQVRLFRYPTVRIYNLLRGWYADQ